MELLVLMNHIDLYSKKVERDQAEGVERLCAGIVVYLKPDDVVNILAPPHPYALEGRVGEPSWCGTHYEIYERFRKAGLTSKHTE